MSGAARTDVDGQAKKLVAEGWHTNLAHGAVTRLRDCKSGLVEDAVWEAMQLLERQKGWGPTDPQALTPGGTW